MAITLKGLWPAAKRGIQYTGGSEAPDVDGTPYWVECKCGKRTNIKAAVKQATDASDGRPIVVISKNDREETLVTMLIGDWYALHERRASISKEKEDRSSVV
jgi:hypothetical protein